MMLSKIFISLFGVRKISKSSSPILGLTLIWLLACILALTGLGNLPLRDFDEATVARVAMEITQRSGLDQILPTIWGDDYLNKPPGLHWLIALAIKFENHAGGQFEKLPSEFAVRFVPAFLSTLVVPFGGLIQWYLRPKDITLSVSTAAILLTLMPLVRHGRLAMLDGTQLSLIALLWLFFVSMDQSYFDKFRSFGAGITSSCLLMLKAPILLPALLACAIPFVLEKKKIYKLRWSLLITFVIGLLPGISWHVWHGIQRGSNALWLWGGDGAVRVLFDAGEGSDLGVLVPLIEVLEGGWPWLVLWPIGLIWAWEDRNTSWGKWTLATQVIMALSILPLKTQLPWYSHPLWLPFSLIAARPLAWLINRQSSKKMTAQSILSATPYFWLVLGAGLILFGLLGTVRIIPSFSSYSGIAFACGIGWLVGGWLFSFSYQELRALGALSLVAGSFLGLFVFMRSSFWLWELNENWPVLPVAELASVAKESDVFIEGSHERPSLNWYAGRKIKPFDKFLGSGLILTRDSTRLINLSFEKDCKVVKKEGEWALLSCQNN